MSHGVIRSTLYAVYTTLTIAVISSLASAAGFSGCGDIEITTVSHEDTVVLPLHIHADTTCSQVVTMQVYLDGVSKGGQSGQTLDYDLTSATQGTHRLVVQGVDGGTPQQVKIKS